MADVSAAESTGTEHETSAPRPLAAVALALIAGALAVRLASPPPVVGAALTAFGLGAWLASRGFDGRGPSLGRPSWTALLALSSLAALAAAPRAAAPLERFEGAWLPAQRTPRGIVGRLRHPRFENRRVELPPGVARAGEWIAVTPVDAPAREARGPEPALRAIGEAGERSTWSVRADEVERLARAPPWESSTAWLAEWRAFLVRRCDVFERGASRDLARAFLCGDSSSLDPDLVQLFTRTGQRHVLAVSGMHVTLLVALFIAPLARRARSRRGALWATAAAVCLALFASMTGSEAPVRRAAIAVAAVLFAPRLARGRRVDTLSLLALGVVSECAFDARIVFSVSFQLSYVATAALILGTRPMAELLAGPRPLQLGPTTARLALSIAAGRAVRSALAASAAAVVFTLPLCWTVFGEWAPAGVIVTALLTPVAGFMLAAGWTAIALQNAALAQAFQIACEVCLGVLELADRLPGTPHVLPARPVGLLALAALALAWALRRDSPVGESVLRDVRARLAALLWGAALLPWALRPPAAVIDALDVGHGTCVVVRTSSGPAWIFDAGSRDRTRVGPAALGPLLAGTEVGELCVVLSHEDADHDAALPWLVERYPVRQWLGAVPALVGERLAHTAARIDVPEPPGAVELLGPGGLRARLLRGEAQSGNEGSRILELAGPSFRLALHGDATAEGLRAAPGAVFPAGLAWDVLLWPHHGDDAQACVELLERCSAREVWLSASGAAPVEPELRRREQFVRSTASEGPLRQEFRPP
jgi:competence protein ComEC